MSSVNQLNFKREPISCLAAVEQCWNSVHETILIILHSANINSETFYPSLQIFFFCFENCSNLYVYIYHHSFQFPRIEMLYLSLIFLLLFHHPTRWQVWLFSLQLSYHCSFFLVLLLLLFQLPISELHFLSLNIN